MFEFWTWRPEAVSHLIGLRVLGQESKLLGRSWTNMSGSEKPTDRFQTSSFAQFFRGSLSLKRANRSFPLLGIAKNPNLRGSVTDRAYMYTNSVDQQRRDHLHPASLEWSNIHVPGCKQVYPWPLGSLPLEGALQVNILIIWDDGKPDLGDICIPTADSCWGLSENNKIL